MDPLLGVMLDDRYRLAADVGEGAMGRVYRADKLDGSGQVAIKVLNEECSSQADLRERFEREARALFGLQHPHILDVQDFGITPTNQPYLVMELLQGESLDELVDSETLQPDQALELGRQLLDGLAFAHGQGAVHRDLKSENIFVVKLPDGRLHAKLLDFGLVKFTDDQRWGEGKKLTVAGAVMGSPAYMSPEQATGGAMDARSDVYSAGIVLYELLTGSWPFDAESRVDMLKAHLLSPVPTLAAGSEGLQVRPELEAIIQKALAKDADERYCDAREMLAALVAIPAPAAWVPRAVAPAKAAFPSPARPMGAPGLPPPGRPMGGLPPRPMSPPAQPMPAPLVAQPPAPQPFASQPLAPQPLTGQPMAAQAPVAQPLAGPAMAAAHPVHAATKAPASKLPLIVLGAVVAFCLLSGVVAAAVALLVG